MVIKPKAAKNPLILLHDTRRKKNIHRTISGIFKSRFPKGVTAQ